MNTCATPRKGQRRRGRPERETRTPVQNGESTPSRQRGGSGLRATPLPSAPGEPIAPLSPALSPHPGPLPGGEGECALRVSKVWPCLRCVARPRRFVNDSGDSSHPLSLRERDWSLAEIAVSFVSSVVARRFRRLDWKLNSCSEALLVVGHVVGGLLSQQRDQVARRRP